MTDTHTTQLDQFKSLARVLEADDDEARWYEKLAKVVNHNPAPETPE
jgi:hypothetical protein